MIVTGVPGGCVVSVQDWWSALDQSPGCDLIHRRTRIICCNTLFDEKWAGSHNLHTNRNLHLFERSLMILLCLRVV